MKKYISLSVIAILLLSACDNSAEAEYDNNAEEEAADYLENSTDNVMEFISDDDYDVYLSDYDSFQKIATYSGEVTNENGIYTMNEDGYEESLRFILVEDEAGEKFLAVAGEQVNGTDESLSPSQLWYITTDTMEQTNTEVGMEAFGGEYKPNTKHQGISLAPLSYPDETPQELNVETGGVDNVYSDGTTYEDDYYVEPTEFTLTIDE